MCKSNISTTLKKTSFASALGNNDTDTGVGVRYGGFPLWLHFIPGIQFRTTNTPFKVEMKRFLTKIVSMMKEENLFASQGGPIILAQVIPSYSFLIAS
ncbi:hypothetical protein GIB67_025083 [Kingdonia uniflora]|uniref:beta-galactosidase n=1 Tax=Kingdonia uniflora TaxID=39325 RepID=A0A7J7N7L7_9MAGN|nr:hypothetical protein GIB67_025083 [Kingdonia uniflora]